MTNEIVMIDKSWSMAGKGKEGALAFLSHFKPYKVVLFGSDLRSEFMSDFYNRVNAEPFNEGTEIERSLHAMFGRLRGLAGKSRVNLTLVTDAEDSISNLADLKSKWQETRDEYRRLGSVLTGRFEFIKTYSDGCSKELNELFGSGSVVSIESSSAHMKHMAEIAGAIKQVAEATDAAFRKAEVVVQSTTKTQAEVDQVRKEVEAAETKLSEISAALTKLESTEDDIKKAIAEFVSSGSSKMTTMTLAELRKAGDDVKKAFIKSKATESACRNQCMDQKTQLMQVETDLLLEKGKLEQQQKQVKVTNEKTKQNIAETRKLEDERKAIVLQLNQLLDEKSADDERVVLLLQQADQIAERVFEMYSANSKLCTQVRELHAKICTRRDELLLLAKGNEQLVTEVHECLRQLKGVTASSSAASN